MEDTKEEDVWEEGRIIGDSNYLVGMFIIFMVITAYYYFTGHDTNDIIPFLIIAIFCIFIHACITHYRERDKDLCEGED